MQKFLRGFFWFAFASFLAASIPHVAYFFRSYEPQGDGRDILWWCVSFAIAVSIDITIFLLSVTVAGLHRRGSSHGLIASVWFFILGLTALSWLINWEYAQEFASTMLAHVDTMQVNLFTFAVGKVGDINPVIASMFQVLAIAYTWIADKIASDEKPKTAAELKAEADELARVETQKRRIAEIKRESNKGLISGLGDSIRHARTELKHALQTDSISSEIEESNQEQSPEESEAETIPITEAHDATSNEYNAEELDSKNKPDNVKMMGSSGPASGKTVTIKEAAERLGLSVNYVRDLRNNGTLKRSPRNRNLLLKSSVERYQTLRQNGHKKEPIAGELIEVREAS